MQKPASFSKFLLVATCAVGASQLAVLVLLAFMGLGAMFTDSREAEPPSWTPILCVVLAILSVAFTWVLYRRGELDVYDSSRKHRR